MRNQNDIGPEHGPNAIPEGWELCPNPELSNNTRAGRGNTALSAWVNENGDQGDEATNMRDMLSDLMHLADALGIDFHEECETATRNHNSEAMEFGTATAVGEEGDE